MRGKIGKIYFARQMVPYLFVELYAALRSISNHTIEGGGWWEMSPI